MSDNVAPTITVATGEPGWIPVESWSLDGARTFVAVDVDGDGDLDIAAAGYGADQFVWYENVAGTFGAASPIVIDSDQNGAIGLAAGNVDGDTDVDIVGTSYLDDEVVLYVNDGSGDFSRTLVGGLDGARGVTLADVDGDGDLDIVAAGYVADKVVWYQNAGDGTFGAEQVLGAADGANHVVAADMDGDGDLDLLATAYNGDEVQYFENQGGGTFAAAIVIGSLNGASGLAVGDLDGDGDLDVVAGGTLEDEVVWYENAGDGSFAEGATIAIVDGPQGVSLTDLDGDGDLDVLVASDAGDSVLTVENLGSGSFAAAKTILGANGAWQVTVAEIGGVQTAITSASDGDVIALTQQTSGTIALAPGEPSPILGISFSDDDAAGVVTVSIEISAGVLSATSGDGVTVDGDGTTSLTLSGAIADINAFIAAGDVAANVPFGESAYLKVGIDDGSGADNAAASALVSLYFGTAPSGITLSSDSVPENVTSGTVVGDLSASDPDADDTLSYELVDDAGGLFALATEDGVTSLVVNGELDYETATSHTVQIKVTDGRYEATETLTVKVADVGEDGAPIDIALSNTSILESARNGTTIGTLSATDPEGGPITWDLPSGQGDNGSFNLKTGDDGSVSVVLNGTLDHESSGGVYDLVVTATDQEGKTTVASISITVDDDPFKLSSVPTGKDYTSIMESAPVGTQIGYVIQFDSSFVPQTVELSDDAGGLFSITPGEVSGTTYYYLTVNGALDHETADLLEVTIKATDAGGVSQEKTFEVHVLDAPEATDEGLAARGTITIDASTAASGIDWDGYLDAAFANVIPGLPGFLPTGTGWSPDTPSSEFLYTNLSDGSMLSLKGSDLVYNWVDPISGEDAHVVSGTINEMVFGTGVVSPTPGITEPEVSITGLDLSNDSSLMNRIFGEAQIVAQAWMYGLHGNSPGDIELVKAVLASYAQNFIGSDGDDTYTGTLFDDTITGGKGNDTLRGGGGSDTAVYSGDRSDYEWTDNGDGTWTITDSRTGEDSDGVDTLEDIQYLEFADGTVAIDGPGDPVGTITIDASGSSSGIDFEAYIRGGFISDATGGGFPVFDNGSAFSGEEMVIAYGSEAASKYVLAHGDIEYYFGTHTVAGTINTIEYGTLGAGSYDANGYLVGSNVQLRITGLDLSNAIPGDATEEAEIEANGSVHNFSVAHMYGASADQARLDAYADSLDDYAQIFIGSEGDDIYVGTAFDDTISGGGGEDILGGGGGNDTVDGGDGADTWVLSGNYADYEVSTVGAVTTVTDRRSNPSDGIATLTNIETLLFADQSVAIVDDLPPVGITLSSASVSEVAPVDTVVGIISATDPEGGALSFAISGDDAGKFRLVGNELRLKAGLDYETATSHAVSITVSDEGGNTATKTFVIDVVDYEEGTNGRDKVKGTKGDDLLAGLGGNDKIKGRNGDDVLDGGAGKDKLFGGNGDDTLIGGAGKDVLKGGKGDDILIGGPGKDVLKGGKGADTFKFEFASDSLVKAKGRDVIKDFSRKQGDKIDVSGIDPHNDSGVFDFVGKAKFSGEAGELRYAKKGGKTLVSGDIDGDGQADFSIALSKAMHLHEADFVL